MKKLLRLLLVVNLTLVGASQPSTVDATTRHSVATFTPLDEHFALQVGTYQPIAAEAMWERGLTGISATHPITIAVLDTGVDLDHPDLNDNLVPGYDFVDLDDVAQDTSADSHGTLVAGIIAAEMNNDRVADDTGGEKARGVVGIGGGDELSNTLGLRIMPVRVAASSGDGVECARSAQAIDYARTHNAQIINISYGSSQPCAEERAAIQRAYDAGLIVVAGAGNDNQDTPFYPAAYAAGELDDLVIAVVGVYPSGLKSDDSNYGTWVDIGAPYRVYSTTNQDGYALAAGTSFSAPFVTGLLGVLISNYGWSRQQALSTLRASADNLDAQNPSHTGQLGAGRINAGRASSWVINALYLPLVNR